jgi:hypothetical protein
VSIAGGSYPAAAIFETSTEEPTMGAAGVRTQAPRVPGVFAVVVGWLGWFEIAPALGFPTIGPAAMLNRIFVPESDPGVLVGWVVLVLALVLVAALSTTFEPALLKRVKNFSFRVCIRRPTEILLGRRYRRTRRAAAS